MNKKTLTLMAVGMIYAGVSMGQNFPEYNAGKNQKTDVVDFLKGKGFKEFNVDGDTLYYKSLPNTNFYVLAPIAKTGFYVGLEGETRSVATSYAQEKAKGLEKSSIDELTVLDAKDKANNIIEF